MANETNKLVRTLKNRSEFNAVRSGKRYVCNNFIMQGKTGKSELRVGFTITKKVGNAVVRNRIRRRLKHAFATSISQLDERKKSQLADVVLVAKVNALTTSHTSLVEELTKGIDHIAAKGKKTAK